MVLFLPLSLFLHLYRSLSFFPSLRPILCGSLPTSISFYVVLSLLPSPSLWFSSNFHLILCVLFLLPSHSLWFSSCFHLIICGSLPTSISFSMDLFLLPSNYLWFSSCFHLILCGSLLPTFSSFSVVLSYFHLILCGSLPASISLSVVLFLLPSYSLWFSSCFLLIFCGSLPTSNSFSVILFLVQGRQST